MIKQFIYSFFYSLKTNRWHTVPQLSRVVCNKDYENRF